MKNSFADRLQALRRDQNLSQRELAEKTSIHHVQLSRYESGKAVPTAASIQKLADALNTTSDFLIDGNTNDVAQDRLSDKELLGHFQAAEKLPESQKLIVKQLLHSFIKLNEMEQVLHRG